MINIQPLLARLYQRRAWLRKLAQKGTLALLEQGLFSGSTFVVNILLIRWLSATSYGAYTLAFAILIFVSGFYQALILDPIAIYGTVKHRAYFVGYSRVQAINFYRLALLASVMLGFIAGGMAVLGAQRELQLAFWGITLGQGGWLSLWLLRRLYYARHQVGKIALLTGLYTIVQAGILVGLHTIGLLTPFSAYVGPAIATYGIGAIGLMVLGKPTAEPPVTRHIQRNIMLENWHYGRWLMVASVFNWLSNYAYFVLVGVILSIEETGALRAVQNLTLPATQFVTAIAMLFFPLASEQFAAGGYHGLRRISLLFTMLNVIGGMVYFGFLLLFDQALLDLLYAGSYSEYRHLIPMLGLLPIMIGLTTPFALAIRIGYNTLYTFFLDLSSTIVVFSISLYLTFQGLESTVIGMLLSNMVRIVVLIWLWRYLSRRRIHEEAVTEIAQHP